LATTIPPTLWHLALAATLCAPLACEPATRPDESGTLDETSAAELAAEPAPEPAPEPVVAEATESATAPAPAPTPRVATLEYDGGRFDAEFGGRGQLPTDFPDDVPIYPDSEPQSSFSAPGRGQIVHLRTGSDASDVFDSYREGLAELGWEEESATSRLGNHEITTRKGNRVTHVTIRTDGTATMILLAVGEERS